MTQREQTARERIIAAAHQVLAERGLEAASVKEIARQAGVAPGLVHYYFANKEELLSTVLREASARYTVEMAQLAQSHPAEALAEAALRVPAERLASQPEWYRLRYELFALGLRHPGILPALADLLQSGRQGIAQVVQKAVEAPTFDSKDVAAVLLACFDGLALQKLADPQFDLDGAYQILARMLEPLRNGQ